MVNLALRAKWAFVWRFAPNGPSFGASRQMGIRLRSNYEVITKINYVFFLYKKKT
jgi:hypothetical protein